ARSDGVVDTRVYEDPKEQKRLWDAREGGLGATAFVPGEPDAWPGWEDSAVPPEGLGAYLRELRALFDRYDYHPALYGHFGMGLVHCRVPFDLYDEHGIAKYRRFLDEAADLVVAHGGSLSGEHGDGEARGELLVKMFGADLVSAMRELKAIFDPQGGMNPGKIVDPYPITDAMRVRQDYDAARFDTHFRYADDAGSFARATMRCVGVGKCRQKHGEGHEDIMCPSYMVTHEEEHSTRGRAHLLFEMVRGDGPITEGWKSEAVKESLDLCLACKGCKGECPVNVDMATYKAEFSSHYWEGRVRPRHMYAFGFIDQWARLAELAPGVANLATQLPGIRALAKLAAGIDARASLPPFAPKTFRALFREREPRVRSEKKAVLWPDTFNDHFHPDTAMAAVEVLEHAGFEVVVPEERVCCGRPLYDFGFLDEARGYLERALAVTRPYVDAGMPIVVLEPSCASVFRDELVQMLPARDDAQSLAASVRLFSEVLEDVPLPKLANRPRAIVQGHCHHKSVLHFDAEEKLFEKLGIQAEVLSAGCCGMAGSFGFAAQTHDVGVAAGERALLPRVRREAESTIVAADGFSCREQIRQRTSRTALHVAEIAKMAIDADVPPRASPPEARIAAMRRRAVTGSMLRAGGAIAVAMAAAWLVVKRRRR
ncbi:MAG TPA: FAD-linked oxidase C-terminal domain-containing protein, partial [Labilithrix sp.]